MRARKIQGGPGLDAYTVTRCRRRPPALPRLYFLIRLLYVLHGLAMAVGCALIGEGENMWQRFTKSVRANILVGLILITPLAVTLWIVQFLFRYLTNYLVPREWLQTEHSIFYRMLALLLVFSALYLIGLLARNFIGRHLYRLGDGILTRIPIVKTLYLALRQVSESVVNSRRTLFKQVVAVQFPRAGLYSIGFMTAELNRGVAEQLPIGQDSSAGVLCVFVPTAPNPTTGFFLMVPRGDVIFLDIGLQDAMKMIFSAGAVLPGKTDEPGKTLLDRLDEWLRDD